MINYLKIQKAYWLRWFHLVKHVLFLKEFHMAYDEEVVTYFCGIKVWTRAKKIGCTCGKVWYSKEKNKKNII
jgi:hypothetical protein